MALSLAEEFGEIDVYLFDLLLRGRIVPGMRVLDAGCGRGRNLVYLMRAGYDVFGVDTDASAVAAVRGLAARLAPRLPASNFIVEPVEAITLADRSVDAVISSAVLHFARDRSHFEAMVVRMWRLLTPGGLLFCRLASATGLDTRVTPVGSGRFLLPDGSERYLVTESQLMELTQALGATLVDPIKSTIVQDRRCMATWVIRAAG